MILILAFVRTLAVGFSCLLAGLIAHTLLAWGSRQVGLHLSSRQDTMILLGCVLGAWIGYRLFFRQIWEKEGEEWVKK